MEQSLSPCTSPSPISQPLLTPPKPDVQPKVTKFASQVQLVEDVESEISALQKKLIQQAEKYDHDMEVITQVCTSALSLCKLHYFLHPFTLLLCPSIPSIPPSLLPSLPPTHTLSPPLSPTCCMWGFACSDYLFSFFSFVRTYLLKYNRAYPPQTPLPQQC